MQHAYLAARTLVDVYGDTIAKSWFFGTNSRLDDEAPATVLRDAACPQDTSRVVRAARSFANAEFS